MHGKRGMAVLLLVVAGAVEAQVNTVRHRLEVETGAGKVLVLLSIENHGEATIWVPREVATEDELIGRRFELREAQGGKEVAYIGPMVKRGAYTADDYLAVAAHTMHVNTIDISLAYAFVEGSRDYEIRYPGPYLRNLARLDVVDESPSAPLRFSYRPR